MAPIHGRRGTFVIEAVGVHNGKGRKRAGASSKARGRASWPGITGQGGFDASGGKTVSYHLDYRLSRSPKPVRTRTEPTAPDYP